DLGWELIASGGTARHLRAADLDVVDVGEVTGAPEMLEGRVKTLHPAIHAGILARDSAADRQELEAHDLAPIDLVVCNLYPFRETVAQPEISLREAVEQIDVGGVTLLRAAAKNFDRVTVLSDPADYHTVLEELGQQDRVSDETRRALALKAFRHTRDYDEAIAQYLAPTADPLQESTDLPHTLRLELAQIETLRYGENPHQPAGLYATDPAAGPLGGELLQGKPLSYNNLLDLDAAWRAAVAFDQPAVVIVKHLSPCGIAIHPRLLARAFPAALESDPVSAFGGVIGVNRPVEEAFAHAVGQADLFVEAIIAPAFSPEAQTWFAEHKKNCRLLALPDVDLAQDEALNRFDLRAVRAGYLLQAHDVGDPPGAEWRAVSKRAPTAEELEALTFAWRAISHVTSNAIVFAAPDRTVGIGGGLPSRVDAVRLAAQKAGDRARGAVMASDAFFPFPDGLEVAADAGVTAVIQPGGSVRDEIVIAAADKRDMAMIFTGVRHFRH
ncbi:MAG: bifunctional phosphoribosylaminoimidazolecarboxamide formyltransferase/IMP cyclohydrolase, partial [Chloroflexota bacterium]